MRRANTFAVYPYFALSAIWFRIVTGAVIDLTFKTASVAHFVGSSQVLIGVTAVKRSIYASDKKFISGTASDEFLVFSVSEQFAAIFFGSEEHPQRQILDR